MRDVNIKLTMSLDKAIKILDCFSFDKQHHTIESICKLVGIPKTTAYRLLYTLEANGLIYYDSDNATYCLGMKMFEYGGIVMDRLDIKKMASPYIISLHQKTGLSVTLSIMEGDRIIYLDKAESIEVKGFTSKIGTSREPHFGSPGRVFLADMDESRVMEILNRAPLKKYTDFTITDPNQFLKQLKKIKEQGYSADFEEIILGVAALASPIRDKGGRVIATVTVVGNRQSFDDYPLPELAKQVCDCTNQISLAVSL